MKGYVLSVTMLLQTASAVRALADPILSSRLMYVPFTSDNAHGMDYRARLFRILNQEGKDKGAGKPLSDNAYEEAEWPAYGRAKAHEFGSRVFPTGGEGQCIAFPAAGNWKGQQGTITFWVKGCDWDTKTPESEELITLDFTTGSITFGKTAPDTLSLLGLGGVVIASFPIDFDANRLHAFAITFDGRTAQIFVDGQPRLPQPSPLAFPAELRQIIVGQRSPGKTTNKWLDDVATYDRPLLLSEINRLVVQEGGREGRKRIAVIQTDHSISIDGVMEPGEWDNAAQVTGLLHVMGGISLYNFWGPAVVAADQSAFWVTYDDENLYVAHFSPPPARIVGQDNLIVAMLKNTISLHDSNVDYDDNIRISLLKPYPNGDEYKVYINGMGTTYEFNSSYGAPGSRIQGINLSWDPQIVQRSQLTRKGWTIEVAVPWKDFYFGKPADGEVLHMNLCRLWRQIINEDHAWVFGDRHWKDDTLMELPGGEVLFQGREGLIVRLRDIGQVRRGMVNFQLDLLNRTRSDRHVHVSIDSNSGELTHSETLIVPAGQSLPFSFPGKVVDFRTNEISLTVSDAKTQETYHITTLPLVRKDRPEIYVRKYRTKEIIKFEANLECMGQYPLETISTRLLVRHRTSGRMFLSKSYSGFTSLNPEFEASTRNWPLGVYDCMFTFRAKGTKPYSMTVEYDRVALPEWWNNDIGKEHGVPYPWTPMKVQDDTIHCWGRAYQFGKRLLPLQILTQGRPMLRAPMCLLLKTPSGEVLDSATGIAEGKWTKVTDTRVEGLHTLDGKSIAISNSLWSEYDGLIWSHLTLQPKGRVVVNSLELQVPLSREFTDVINTYDYSLRGTGKLKLEGFVSGITPVWLGNGDGGFQWFCETDGWFFVQDTKRVVRVEMTPEGAILRIAMIDVPTELSKPHDIEFGCIATPVRPKTRRTWSDPDLWVFRGGPGPWYPQGQEFLPAPDYWGGSVSGWRNVAQQPEVKMWMQNIYITTGAVNTQTEDFNHFGDEWLADEKERPQTIARVTHASKSYRDWFVWRHWQSFQRNPHQSLYYDCAIETPSTNRYASAGYVRSDGTVAVTYPILGARDIAKRLYNMIIKYYPFAWVGMHQSGMTNMAYCGFSNHFWDGENFNSIINDKQPTYRGIMNPAMFRAEYMGHNFGSQVMFLGQARIRPEWADKYGVENVLDQLHGLMLLHDNMVPGWQIPGERDRAIERTHNAMARHCLESPAYSFVPYWRQDFVQLPSNEMYASFYILNREEMAKTPEWKFHNATAGGNLSVPKKVVMIVYNDSNWEGTCRLKPDWKRLGFETLEGIEVENAVHSTGFRIEKVVDEKGQQMEKGVFFPRPSEYARIEGSELVFPMTAWNFRMIAMTQKG